MFNIGDRYNGHVNKNIKTMIIESEPHRRHMALLYDNFDFSYFVVLKEGVYQLGRVLSDEELKIQILKDIEKTLRYGSRTVDTEGEVVIYEYEGIKVFVSIKKENVGSIQTARPALHG